jgi:hypothetical protein
LNFLLFRISYSYTDWLTSNSSKKISFQVVHREKDRSLQVALLCHSISIFTDLYWQVQRTGFNATNPWVGKEMVVLWTFLDLFYFWTLLNIIFKRN